MSALHLTQNDYSLWKKYTVSRSCVAVESRVNTQSLKVNDVFRFVLFVFSDTQNSDPRRGVVLRQNKSIQQFSHS